MEVEVAVQLLQDQVLHHYLPGFLEPLTQMNMGRATAILPIEQAFPVIQALTVMVGTQDIQVQAMALVMEAWEPVTEVTVTAMVTVRMETMEDLMEVPTMKTSKK